MATGTVQVVFPLLLVLSSLLAASSSGSDPEKTRCVMECRGTSERGAGREQQREEAAEGGRTEHNPYYFGERSYEHWSRSEHGRFKVLERFSRRSELLIGIENYRLAIMEAEPETFIMPSHWDAEEIFYVMEGRGTITLLHEENRESHEIKRGDIMRIPAGVIVYAINKAENERLRIAMLLHPISTPGHFEVHAQEFFGAAGSNPESFYSSFSKGVLEAAFNIRETLRAPEEGEIIKITEEQIGALSQTTGFGGDRPFAESNEPYNLLQKRPSHANEFGELYEARSSDYHRLQDLDVDVSIANISEIDDGTKLQLPGDQVGDGGGGRGHFEMVCPRRSGEARGSEDATEPEGQQRVRYRTVRSQVSRGSVFVIPPGHPVTAVADANENLQVLCFGIRAGRNRKYYLAGKNNVMNELDREAKQLSFGAPAEEVQEVFDAQPESVFLPGPGRRRGEAKRRQPSVESLFGFRGF
ncbi:Cupin [Musa troglodytarum]|uniref:Cupin n=1 Tax=Musa troglodytarum TaxID=320322 RepID=A0A9E7KP50_9LILI|nr:Cupin [Musa troglodytarum]